MTPSVLPHLTGHTDQPWQEAVGEGLYKSVNPRRTNQWGPPLKMANTQKAKELVPEETSQHPLPLMAQWSATLFSVEVCSSLPITSHQKPSILQDRSRSHTGQPPTQTPIRMAPIKKTNHAKCWRGCRAQELSSTAGVNVKQYNHLGKQSTLPSTPDLPLLGIYLGEKKHIATTSLVYKSS